MLLFAVLAITLALVFYTCGVWGERISGSLKKTHLLLFWTGFVFDTTGTSLMTTIAGNGFILNFHGISGILAIVLMLIHAVWASVVLAGNDSGRKRNFHKFSLLVWIIWLVPFITGAILGMAGSVPAA
jgi:TIGR03987 family protein